MSLLVACSTSKDQLSPNGKLRVSVQDGVGLTVDYKDGKAWQTVMKIDADVKPAKNSSLRTSKVEYDMLTGKRSHNTNEFLQRFYYDATGNSEIIIRAYNDGVAIKAVSPNEIHTDFSSSKNRWLMRWSDSYEGFFPLNPAKKEGDRIGYPALFEYENGVFALLSESGIDRINAASTMFSDSTGTKFWLRPDGDEIGGWQTLIVGSLADVVESTLITDNSDPCRLEDTSWIEPGVASWIYWAYNHGSNDMEIIRMYIDMAVELKLPYVLIDAEWDEMKDGYTVEDAVKYAVDRGIKPMIWYNSSVGWLNGAPGPKFRLNDPADREKELAWCESIGVKGVKIDFFSGDNNMNVRYMLDLIESCAKHHLLVNFHGAPIPRGWMRTYPNLISTEGVYGAEWYNNTPMFTKRAAAHNAMLPFTRNVVGSMDYTPCAFTDSQHPPITTPAHALALPALFESGIQHLADRPESFLAQPQDVKDYLGKLPTAWDDTKYISGYPGESAVLARRKGSAWYVAGINGLDDPQVLDLSVLSSLKISFSKATLFEDSGNADDPWKITSPSMLPSSIKCLSRGGFVLVLE